MTPIRQPWLRAVPAADLAASVEAADREAVRQVLDGDVEAFAELVERHGGRLVSLCARLAGSRAVGEELAQEALARAFERLGSFRDDAPVKAWLARIAVNACRDYLKAAGRRERPAAWPEELVAVRLDPEREVAGRRSVAALERAIGALPPHYREAFVLFHVEGMPYEAMHAATGVRINALKVRVHRARELLRRALGTWLEGEDR